MKLVRVAALTLCTALAAAPAIAAEGSDTDWPCVQRKVPVLTPAAVWTGPAIDDTSGDWRADGEVADLVARLSQRRMPMEEAEAEIEAFADALDEASADRLTLLFAGLFQTMNRERGDIIEGIERYARRQRQVADTVRTMAAEFGALQRDPGADPASIAEARTQLEWQTRIFNERRASLPYVCEVPRFVEQRLFALGRAITRATPD